MTLPELINRPCTLIRRSPSEVIDELGDEIPDVTETAGVWEVQQRSAAESEEEVSETAWVAFFLPGTDLRNVDAILDPELGRFELVGDPWPARNPRTHEEHHVEAQVRRASAQIEAGS